MSTGPVGFSDALGYNNASLIKSTCATDGLLLKPSLPLAAVDRSFCLAKAGNNASGPGCGGQGQPPLPPHSQLWATHTVIGENTWYYVVGIAEVPGALAGASLLRTDLYPALSSGADVLVWEYRDPAGSAVLMPGKGEGTPDVLATMTTTQTSDGDFKYVIVSPVMADSGWVFLGELGKHPKMTPVSVQRGWEFDFAEGFLAKMTTGAPGENVTVAAWKAGTVYSASMVLDNAGEGAVSFT